MKTITDLYPQVCDFETLYAAYRKARMGKRGKEGAAAFERRQEEQLIALRDELRAQTYMPGLYATFYIHEPKRRLIAAAPFRDRVVHHALCSVIEPIWESLFIADNYANRVGKGTHRALDRCQQFARRYPYVLQCDVKQFFPSIDHTILSDILAWRVRDAGVLWLCERILASGVGLLPEGYEMDWFRGDDLFSALRPRGLPIGNLTSQFWANVYLNDFDHFVKREFSCPAYIRYVDDFLLFSEHKSDLHAWRGAVIERLSGLRLKLHESRAQVYPTLTGIPFLGFRIYLTHRRLKTARLISYRRKLKRLVRAAAQDPLQNLPALQTSLRGWVNHVRYGDTWGLRRKLLGSIRL
jgi:hypothetical protein